MAIAGRYQLAAHRPARIWIFALSDALISGDSIAPDCIRKDALRGVYSGCRVPMPGRHHESGCDLTGGACRIGLSPSLYAVWDRVSRGGRRRQGCLRKHEILMPKTGTALGLALGPPEEWACSGRALWLRKEDTLSYLQAARGTTGRSGSVAAGVTSSRACGLLLC
jgi:hypothetical protein